MREELYQQIRDHSFNLARFMTRNYHDAEDIAQIVSVKYLLNEKDILNPLAWSRTVTKHEVYIRTKKVNKSEQLLPSEQLENYEDNLTGFIDDLKGTEKKITTEEAKELLSKDDFRIFKYWLKYKFNVTKLAKVLKLSYHSTHTRVYKMKRNLRAQKLQKEGYTTSRDIIDYNTNKNIVKFIKIFVKKMKENDLSSLHSYLENVDIECIERLNIADVLDYHVRLLNLRKYEIVIPHIDIKKEVGFCFVTIHINKKNQIKVTEFQAKPTDAINLKVPQEKVEKILPRKIKGIIPINFEEAKKMLNKELK